MINVIYFLIFILGAVIGSFLNVVICRLPEKKSVVRDRSACPHCKAIIKPIDLIPIVSFFILGGKCRQCRKNISWQYPLVEFITGLIFVFLAYYHNIIVDFNNLAFYRDLVFACGLLVVFMTDLLYYYIFDAVVLPMMFFAGIVNFFLLANSTNYLLTLGHLALAAVVGGGFFYIQYVLSKGKWVGGGDIYLGIMMGLMLSWPNILVALFIAYVGGALVSLGLMIFRKKGLKSIVPFAVFLSAATFIVLLYGTQILNWYLGLLY